MHTYKIDRVSIEMAELANRLRVMSNAADGYHAQQHGGTYGAASEALNLALACGLTQHSKIHFGDAMKAAGAIAYQCIDNGENVTYQIEKVFASGTGYHDEDGAIWFIIEVVEPEPERLDFSDADGGRSA